GALLRTRRPHCPIARDRHLIPLVRPSSRAPALVRGDILSADRNWEERLMSLLDGRTILVTGASKGIGAAIAAALGREGAHVIAHYGTDQVGARAATAHIPAERVKLLSANLAAPGAAAR